MDSNGLVDGVKAREVPALARAISLVEDGRPGYEALLSELHPSVGRSHRIGITGPPGAGKSTLIEGLVWGYRERDETVAVVAVDPTSTFSGGALLGDRIRMESVALDPGVFIRSMASRGGVGGLATTTREVCDVLDAFGFDRIIVETIGVGQSELAIAGSADTTALVLVPESGDGVQMLKAGVMEIADLYVLNKADRPGADRLVNELEVMLGIRRGDALRHVSPYHHRKGRQSGEIGRAGGDAGEGAWDSPVLKTVAIRGEGVDALLDTFAAHYAYLRDTGRLGTLRRERLARHTREVVDRTLSDLVWRQGDGEAALEAGLDDIVSGRISPYGLARDIVADLHRGANHDGA